jgi:hypothetical protein
MTHSNKTRIALAVLLAAAAAAAFAQTEADYTFDAATGTITKYSGWDTELVIPASIGGKPVTAIGSGAFEKANLTAVTIPNGITSIGSSAFANNQLTTVTIPGSVVTIAGYAFSENPLTSAVLSEGVATVENNVFKNIRPSLTSISFPSSARVLGNEALYGDYTSAPATVILADNVDGATINALGRKVYYNYIANDRKAGTYTNTMPCEEKTEGDFTYRDTQYGAVIYRYRGNNTRVRIPAELGGKPVKAIAYDDGGALSRSRIAAVLLPDSITYIGRQAFASNELTGVAIPAGVTYIGDYAFESNQLTALTIPEGVTYIGDAAFSGNQIAALTIPSKVTYIGVSAFFRNKLTALSIPGNVKTIASQAFSDNQLASLSIAQGVVSIGNGVFSGSDNKLTAVTIPASVTYIGKATFSGPRISITFPATVTRLGGIPVVSGNGVVFVLQANTPTAEGITAAQVSPPPSSEFYSNFLKAGRYTYNPTYDYWAYTAR